jgi:hypothetical protein
LGTVRVTPWSFIGDCSIIRDREVYLYAMANTLVSILRGTVEDAFGDDMDSGIVVYSGIPAFISSPGMSAFRPIILGTTVFEPGTEMPSTVRDITAILPGNTDVTMLDQILDQYTSITYTVVLVTQQGNIGGMVPDMQLTLRRVTTTQPA